MNARLFNSVFKGTPLYFWKQYIWFVSMLLFLFFPLGNSLLDRTLRQKRKTIIGLLIVLMLYAFFTFIIPQFNLIRILFGVWKYTSGIGFLLLPILWHKLGWKQQHLFVLFTVVAFISGVGLVIDGRFNVFSFFGTDTELGAEYGSRETDLESYAYRASFLFEAANTLGYALLFDLACGVIVFFMPGARLWHKLLGVMTVVSLAAGAFYTGSRQIFFLVPVLFGWMLLQISRRLGTFSKMLICMLLLLGGFAGYMGYKQLLSTATQASASRFEGFDLQEDGRIQGQWWPGLQQLGMDNFPYWFSGHGLAYVSAPKALPGEAVGRHYESSLFAVFSELGYFGWLLVYWVVWRGYWNFQKTKGMLASRGLAAYLPFFVVLSCVAPTLTNPSAQMIIWTIFGISLVNRYGHPQDGHPSGLIYRHPAERRQHA